MSTLPFHYASSVDSSTGKTSLSVTFFDDAKPLNFGTDHPSVHRATDAVLDLVRKYREEGEPTPDEVAELKSALTEMLVIRAAVGTKLQEVCGDVTYDGKHIYFQGDALEDSLGKFLMDLLRDEDPQWKAVGKFLNKVMQNPSKDSRDSLFDWLRDRDLTITSEGDFIAYKGVAIDENGVSVSVRSGPGIVDGVVMNGHLPNRQGSTLEMARNMVDADRAVGCSVGLHAGTFDYAKGWAKGRVVKVQINPAHVVSVPSDCHYQKLRVWKYLVLETIEAPETLRVVADYNTDEGDEDEFAEVLCAICEDEVEDPDDFYQNLDGEPLCDDCYGVEGDFDGEDEEDDEEEDEGIPLDSPDEDDDAQGNPSDKLRDALLDHLNPEDNQDQDAADGDRSDDEGDDEDGLAVRVIIVN